MKIHRKISTLKQAEDANEIVTDGMTIEEVVNALEKLFRKKIPAAAWPSANG